MKSSQHLNLIGAHWCPLVPSEGAQNGPYWLPLGPDGHRLAHNLISTVLNQFQPYFSRQQNTKSQYRLTRQSQSCFCVEGALIYWALLAHLNLFQLPDIKSFWNLNFDPKWAMKRHYEEVAFKVCGLLPQERSLLWGVPSAQKSRHHLNYPCRFKVLKNTFNLKYHLA